MNRSGRTTLGIGLVAAIAVVGAATLYVSGTGSPRTAVWTDGAGIRLPVAAAPIREVLWRQAEPLPGAAPDSADEYEPRLSADGTVLVFVRRRPGSNADLFTSRWTPNGRTTPEPIESVNTPSDELGPELSHDGSSIYFYSDRPGGLGGYDLWVSHASGTGWGTPVNLGPRVNSRWNEYGPALTPTADRLYFSSNRPRSGEPTPPDEAWSATVREHRTRHDYDLYSAELEQAEPADAKPVTALNTADDEGSPATSPAGDFLYFASDRAGGMGGFDLYRARIAGPSAFGTAENLGGSINSRANDLDPALSSDGFRLCFSSDRAAPATAQEQPAGRFALWWSVSREVYRSSQADADTITPAWRALWPWLLCLILMLLPMAAILRLLRDPRWRQRFLRLSLVAQCLIVSLLIHAGLASLLTVWKVGAGIIDLIQHEGGGTRVILASGAPGESALLQIRGVVTSGSFATPEFAPIAAELSAEPIATARAELTVPELTAPVTMAPEVIVNAPTVRLPQRVSLTPERAATPAVATPASTLPEDAHHEADVLSTPRRWIESATPSAGLPVSMRDVIELPPRAEEPVRPMDAVDSPGAQERIAAAVAAATLQPIPSPPAFAIQVPKVQASRDAAASEPGTAWAGLDPMQETETPASRPEPVLATRVEVPMRPFADSGGRGGDQGAAVRLGALPSPGGRAEHIASPAAHLTAVSQPNGVPGPSIPRLNADRSVATHEPSVPSAGNDAFPMIAASAGSPVSIGVGTGGIVDPGMPSVRPEPADRSRLALIPDRETEATQRIDGLRVSSALVPQSSGAEQARIPSEPVIPVEDFAQRATESRQELVEKMGGSAETERAVGRALDWFQRHQASDGHWSAEQFDDHCRDCGGQAEFKADAAMTGMVLLCYLGAGHTHLQEGPYREMVKRGLAWLVARQTSDGDLRRGETMYGQTVATVALCESLAMTRDPGLAGPARSGVAFVLDRASGAQRSDDRETSVLGWLVFTVESARRAGIDVPLGTFDAAGKWLDYVTIPGSAGLYSYAKGQSASPAMTAEAMFVQQILGHTRDEPTMERSARFIVRTPPRWGEGAPTFSWYYATLALFQHQGEPWKEWNDALVRELLANQRQEGQPAGSWDPQDQWSRMGGRIYQTAVCTLSLEVYYRYKAK